jgi:hypothetical protein
MASAFSSGLKQEVVLPIVFVVCTYYHQEMLLLDGRSQALICIRKKEYCMNSAGKSGK